VVGEEVEAVDCPTLIEPNWVIFSFTGRPKAIHLPKDWTVIHSEPVGDLLNSLSWWVNTVELRMENIKACEDSKPRYSPKDYAKRLYSFKIRHALERAQEEMQLARLLSGGGQSKRSRVWNKSARFGRAIIYVCEFWRSFSNLEGFVFGDGAAVEGVGHLEEKLIVADFAGVGDGVALPALVFNAPVSQAADPDALVVVQEVPAALSAAPALAMLRIRSGEQISGAAVWLSADGVTYANVGSQNAAAAGGTLQADMPAGGLEEIA
jgi:hypothetical protein